MPLWYSHHWQFMPGLERTRMQVLGWSCTCPSKHKALQPPEEAAVCAARI